MLRIGCVKYLNARPLIYGWSGAVDFDHPAALCRKLEDGDLNVALVSTLEYLRRPIYRIVDGVSISAHGAVYSVIVAHNEDLSRAQEIDIDPASETSMALLRCLLRQRGFNPRLRVRNTDLQSVRPAELHSAGPACVPAAHRRPGDSLSRRAWRALSLLGPGGNLDENDIASICLRLLVNSPGNRKRKRDRR